MNAQFELGSRNSSGNLVRQNLNQFQPVWPPDSPLVPRGCTASASHLRQLCFAKSKCFPAHNSISPWTEGTWYKKGVQGGLPGLESRQTLFGVAWKVHVDRGPHASAQVGGAGVDVAELLGQLEVLARLSLNTVLDSLDATKDERINFLKLFKNRL